MTCNCGSQFRDEGNIMHQGDCASLSRNYLMKDHPMTDKHTPGTCPDLIQCQAFYHAAKDRSWINYCPTHALAPEMAVALDKIVRWVAVAGLQNAFKDCALPAGWKMDLARADDLLSRINTKGGE